MDILTLSQAQNYLYFIDTEFLSRGVIDAIARTDFDLIIIDLVSMKWTAEESVLAMKKSITPPLDKKTLYQ